MTTIIDNLLLVWILSIDALVSGFAYGIRKIRIPFSSVLIINFVCSGMLTIPLLVGSIIRPYIEEKIITIISFLILFIFGLTKLFDSTIKYLIRKNKGKLKLKVFNFVLDVYANPETADIDSSGILSKKESLYLAIALSLDSLSLGFGMGLENSNLWLIITLSFLIGIASVILGHIIGNKIARKIPLNLSWISGLILIILAILRLV